MYFALTIVVAFAFTACGETATNKPAGNASSPAAKPVGAGPTKEALAALETKAFEAWKTKDTKFWDGFLAESFTGFTDGKRSWKADEIKMITEGKCDIKSFAFSDQTVTVIDADDAVLTSKVTTVGTCDGQKLPSPTMSATLFVRSGDAWKAAYHNEVMIIDPKSPPPAPAKKEAAKKDEAKPAEAKDDPTTDALMAVEKAGWDAWKARDAKAIEAVVANEVAFVDPMGNFAASKADAIKAWTEPKCEIKSAAPSDGMGSAASPTVAILTYRGDAEGTCDGQKLGPLWGTSFLIQEGGAWKVAYIFETPA